MRWFGRRGEKTLNLALQGGGAHGAFTWGVLDALLEDGRLRFEGVSGTSAGAMNAVVLAQGLMEGGREGARAALERFWTAVAASVPAGLSTVSQDGERVGPAFALPLMLQWTHYFSPEQLNPFDLDPLRDIVAAQVDFERLRAHSPLKLFVAATHANSGRLRLFRTPEIGVDALLASACLPTLQRAVEIDGEPYWDGGYAANPAVFPLVFDCRARDILLVLLAPMKHEATPHTAQDIRARVLEIAFNATFLREMRMFAHLREHAGRAWLLRGRLGHRVAQACFHLVEAEDALAALGAETRLAANLAFFQRLRELGRGRAQAWLQAHRAALGRRSTADLAGLFY